ncbi:hypothetical protein XTALMG727_3771 [Xanthomonas translucens pv. arrhenatheri LMG 727]|uniref:Uncharacterized protein n=1 Tax=Xanthomonas graminis pv. arrhenatheri LMG 727 TaxID=1195923 RepID=A0A0K3AAA2_9XANT|nr:hypothetical protein XTALMG727_3771 [Xanthomonas translucens pv. arrhenatheri LMG 727]
MNTDCKPLCALRLLLQVTTAQGTALHADADALPERSP